MEQNYTLKGGQKVITRALTKEDLNKLEAKLLALGRSKDPCECGDEVCIDGYIVVCRLGDDNRCQWFESDWQCNP